MDNNSLYGVFDKQYIEQHADSHHQEQVKNVQDAIKNLHDFLDSMDKIEPQYREMANREICLILLNYLNRNRY